MAETKIPSIYRVPSKIDPELKRYLESVQEAIEVRLGRRGDELDQAVTFRDLIDSNLAARASNINRVIGPIIEDPTPTTPFNNIPQNVRCQATFTNIRVSWDFHAMGSLFARAEVWSSEINDPNTKTKATGNVTSHSWIDSVDYNTTKYYWVRFVQRPDENSAMETFGDFSSPAASCTTEEDIGAVMTSLSEYLTDLPGYGTLIGTTVPNLITAANSAFTHVIKSTSAPTTREDSTALQQGDIWIDTDDNNQMYVRNVLNQPTNGTAANTVWVEARDGTLVSLVGATSFTGSTISAALASAQSDIITVTNANTATASSVTSLTSTVNTKSRTFFQDGIPTSTAIGDLWVDTNDSNKMYRAASVGADEVAAGEWVLARDTLNDSYPRVFVQAGIPTSISAGDIWFDSDDSNRQYRADSAGADAITAGEWVEVRDIRSQANIDQEATTRATADTASALKITALSSTVNTLIRNFVQAGIPTSIIPGDLWVDSDDSNKLYRAAIAGADAITAGEWEEDTLFSDRTIYAATTAPTGLGATDAGDFWFDTDDSNKHYYWDGDSWEVIADVRVNSNAAAVEVLNTSVGLSGAEATKITALEASVGKIYGARLYITAEDNTVKVETMVNTASTTTTTAHGITDALILAGVFLTLKGISGTPGGFTAQQLNKTFKVTSRVTGSETTQLNIETVGDAATSTVNGTTTIADGVTIGTNAGLAQLATVTADIEGNAHSSYVLQVSANGSVAGMVIEANASAGGTASAVQFLADKFAIRNSSTTTERTFDGSSGSIINTTNNTITLSQSIYNSLTDEQAVKYNNGEGGSNIGGLTDGTTYYIILVASTTNIQLAVSLQNAISNTAISLTSTGGGSAHTINDLGIVPFIVSSGNVYMASAMIQDASIVGAKIDNATITNAHIFDLDATKITSGTINASAVIRVGSDQDGATSQRIQIDTVSGAARILVVDDSAP